MTDESPAQDQTDSPTKADWSDPDVSDTALLAEALQDALAAHAAGLLAAPFGVDVVALARARRRALRSDIRRLLADQQSNEQDRGNA